MGLAKDKADSLIRRSVSLAIAARDRFCGVNPGAGSLPLVAASIGPYGAVCHDGSEYTGNYAINRQQLRDFHEQRLQLLDATAADVLACETIPNITEAEILCDLLQQADKPAWVSFCCRDDHSISDGTPLQDAAKLFNDHPRVLATGINCTPPQYVVSLIAQARVGAPDKAIVVYPNSGETYTAADNTWSGTVTPIQCGQAARRWREAGRTIDRWMLSYRSTTHRCNESGTDAEKLICKIRSLA